MFARNSRTAGVRSFRPTLESLEERTLLSNVPYMGLLNEVNTAAQQTYQSFTNANQVVRNDVDNFESSPHNVGALVNLIQDTTRLVQVATQEMQLIQLFNNAVWFGEQGGLVKGDTRSDSAILSGDTSTITNSTYYNSLVDKNQALIPVLQNAIADAEANIIAAVDIVFLDDNVPLGSLPSSPSIQSIQDAPSSYCSPSSPSCNGTM